MRSQVDDLRGNEVVKVIGRDTLGGALVRARRAVMRRVLGQHRAKMSRVQDQKVVKHLATQGPYQAFAERARSGCLWRTAQGRQTAALEHGVGRFADFSLMKHVDYLKAAAIV